MERFLRQHPHVLPRIRRAHNVDPHSPCKMADFEVHLAPIWGGRNSGPRSGHSQAVSGLFLVTPDFVIHGEIFEAKSLCPAQGQSRHNVDPHSPCKMADFEGYLVPSRGGRVLGPRSGHFQAVSGLFLVTPDFVIIEEILGIIPMS